MARIGTIEPLSCPVCFELPENVVYQCRNGHPICKQCCEGIQNCPQCRLPFEEKKIRNRVLESLLEIVKVKCPHQNEGCKVILLKNDVASHRRMCKFRPINLCKPIGFKACTFANSKPWLIYNHILKDHIVEQYITPSRSKFYWRKFDTILTDDDKNIKFNIINKTWVWEAHIENQDTAHFLVVGSVHNKRLSVLCINMECHSDDSPQYLVEIGVKDAAAKWATWKWQGESIHYKHSAGVVDDPPFQIPLKYIEDQISINNNEDSTKSLDLELDVTVKKAVACGKSKWRYFVILVFLTILLFNWYLNKSSTSLHGSPAL